MISSPIERQSDRVGLKHCPACGYPRSGQTDNGVCPECGLSFNWHYNYYLIAGLPRHERSSIVRWFRMGTAGAAGVIAAILIAGVRLKWLPGHSGLLWMSWGVGLAGAISCSWSVFRLTQRGHDETDPDCNRSARIIARVSGPACVSAIGAATFMHTDPFASMSVLLALVFGGAFAFSFGQVLADYARRAEETEIARKIRRSVAMLAMDGAILIVSLALIYAMGPTGPRPAANALWGAAGVAVMLGLIHTGLYFSHVRFLINKLALLAATDNTHRSC